MMGFIKKHGVKMLVFAVNIFAVTAGANMIRNQADIKALEKEKELAQNNLDALVGETEVVEEIPEEEPVDVEGQVVADVIDTVQQQITEDREAKLSSVGDGSQTVTEVKPVTTQVPKTVTEKSSSSKSSDSSKSSSTKKKTTKKPAPKPAPKPTTETKAS